MGRRAVLPIPSDRATAEFRADIEAFFDDPLGFVFYVFAWGEPGALEKEEGPDDWQIRVLHELGEKVRAGQAEEGVAGAVQMAVASGHGIGKTCLVAWIILWFISTRPNAQIVVTANTTTQLTTKTWRELAKWLRLARNGSWFQWSAQKLAAKWAPETWFAAAVPWSKERAEAFAGTHDEHVLVIFDEASAIEDIIWEVAEGAMTTAGAMWLAFGNPTRNTGRFKECWGRFQARWFTMQVDSRTAKKASRKKIDQWIEDYGEDSDFVRVRVRGMFPRAASSQFIAEDDVENAVKRFNAALVQKRHRMSNMAVEPASIRLQVEDFDDGETPLIMAVDVARFGADDSVICLRRGMLATMLGRWNGLATTQLADIVARSIIELRPDAVFIDAVGVGAGVVDNLTASNFEVIEVIGGAKALNEKVYFNRRIEMWDEMRKWLRKGGMIEDDRRLRDGLTGPEYGFSGRIGQMQLESKDDMRSRGLDSPDEADALAMTFYQPVMRRETRDEVHRRRIMRALESAGGGASWRAY